MFKFKPSPGSDLCFISLYAACICFAHIHQGTLSIDGIRYAHIALTILRTGDWIHLEDTFLQLSYANKPPFFFWLIALSFKIFGVNSFAARLVGSAFGFIAVILIWRLLFLSYGLLIYGRAAAFAGVILLTVNSVFFRSVADLSFEGIVLCGGLLCFRPLLLFTRRCPLSRVDVFEYLLGLLFLLSSKPPFVLFVFFPSVAFWVMRKNSVNLKYFMMFLTLLASGVIAIASLFFLLPVDSYLSRAIGNQMIRPFTLEQSWSANIVSWLDGVFVSYAPLSWVGLWCLFSSIRVQGVSLSKSEESKENILFLLWVFPVIFIFLFVSFRAQYLFLPFLALVVVGGREIGKSVFASQIDSLIPIWGIGSMAVLLILITIGVQLHRNHPAVAMFKEKSELINDQLFLCFDGNDKGSGVPERRRLQLLLDLEFNYWPEIYSSDGLMQSKLADGGIFLADTQCVEQLTQHKVNFSLLIPQSKVGLYQLNPIPGAQQIPWQEKVSDFPNYH